MRAGGAIAISLTLLASLAACNSPPADRIDEAGADAIAQAAEAALNGPAAAVQQLLKSLDGPSPVGLDDLQASLDQRPVPLDWWLWRQGYVQALDPEPAGPPVFVLTDKAHQAAAAPAAWFEVDVGEPSRVDCQSPAAAEVLGCEVEVEVTPVLLPAIRPLAAGPPPVAIKAHVLMSPTPEGWQVHDLRTDGAALDVVALNAVLGPEPLRQASRADALRQWSVRQALAAQAAGPSAGAAEAAPPVSAADPVAPVDPVIGPSPIAPVRRQLIP